MKMLPLRRSAGRVPSASRGVTVKCLKGSKVAWNLCCLLPTDSLLSGAHPAYVLFTTENFTTLKQFPG